MEAVYAKYPLTIATALSIATCALVRGPVNTTACFGSTAVFNCSATDVFSVFYLVDNMISSILSSRGIVASSPTLEGGVTTVKLNILATLNNNNSQVLCKLVLSNGTVINVVPSAVLVIQDVLPPPEFFDVKLINLTSAKLEWFPYLNHDTSLLSYDVEVRNSSGQELRRTVTKETRLIIGGLDVLCSYYEATVTSSCERRVGNRSIAVPLGSPPSALPIKNVTIELIFSASPTDNVTLNISFFQQRVCRYTIVAVNEDKEYQIQVSAKSSFEDSNTSIVTTLPSNKRFVLVVTTFNGNGEISENFTIGTIDVKDIILDSEGNFKCIFNNRSLAKGCLIQFLNETTGTTFCQVFRRSVTNILNEYYCNESLIYRSIGGLFMINVYDIESDGTLSPVPALTQSSITLHGWAKITSYNAQLKGLTSTNVLLPSSDVHLKGRTSNFLITVTVTSIIVLAFASVVLIFVPVCLVVLIIRK